MGSALKELDKLDEAIEALNKAISIKPDYAEAYYNLGNTFREKGKLNRAIETYTKAVSIKLDYAEAYNNMGIALADQGKPEEANLCIRLSRSPIWCWAIAFWRGPTKSLR